LVVPRPKERIEEDGVPCCPGAFSAMAARSNSRIRLWPTCPGLGNSIVRTKSRVQDGAPSSPFNKWDPRFLAAVAGDGFLEKIAKCDRPFRSVNAPGSLPNRALARFAKCASVLLPRLSVEIHRQEITAFRPKHWVNAQHEIRPALSQPEDAAAPLPSVTAKKTAVRTVCAPDSGLFHTHRGNLFIRARRRITGSAPFFRLSNRRGYKYLAPTAQ